MHCKGKTNSGNNRTKGRIKMRKMLKRPLQNTEILSRLCIGSTTRWHKYVYEQKKFPKADL